MWTLYRARLYRSLSKTLLIHTHTPESQQMLTEEQAEKSRRSHAERSYLHFAGCVRPWPGPLQSSCGAQVG